MKQDTHITQKGAPAHKEAPGPDYAPTRTFVISDAHGHPGLIENGLEHGEFRPGIDDFVYAGDFVDRGPDAPGCLDLIERYATHVLMGNHELAVLLGFQLFEQTAKSRALRQLLLDRVLTTDAATPWEAVRVVDGLLLSHAGVSQAYQRVFQTECQSDPARLAAYLNEAFLAAVRRELLTGDWDTEGIIGTAGPLWFRPQPHSSRLPLAGVTQVVGHTPPLPELEPSGFYMVDPCVFQGLGSSRRYRYAVIENGRVRVQEGSLGPASSSCAPEKDSAVLVTAG